MASNTRGFDDKVVAPPKQVDHSWVTPDESLLEDRRGELPEFPCDVFPFPLSSWLLRANRGAGVRIDHIAVPMFGVASSLIGKARRVQASTSWMEPTTLWTCIVGQSGDRKTPGPFTAFGWFHVRFIPHAERKMHVELRVCLRELMHAYELICRAGTRTNVEREACLVARGTANYDALLVHFDDPRPASAWTLFPSHTQLCSCAVRCAEVMVTCPCTATNAFKKAAAETANERDSRSRFLSS